MTILRADPIRYQLLVSLSRHIGIKMPSVGQECHVFAVPFDVSAPLRKNQIVRVRNEEV
jgi:hypothetical protein